MDSSSSCSSTSIMIYHLPDLVLREIFLNLDVKSLEACKQVCTYWRNYIYFLEQIPSFHFQLCKKEISSMVLLDMLDKLFPDHWKNQDAVDWKNIYDCWYQWNILYGAQFSVKPLLSGLNGISCMQVSGEWLLISTCQRMGKLIAVRLSDGKTLNLYAGGNAIVSIELVHCDDVPEANIPSSDRGELEQFFNTLSHNEIWLELRYFYVRLGRNYSIKVNNVNEIVRHSYGYRLKISNQDFVQVHHLQKVSDEVRGPLVMEKEMPIFCKGSVDFWGNKISFHNISYSEAKIEVLSIDMRTQNIISVKTKSYTLLPAQHNSFYSWKNSMFFIHSDAPMLMVLSGKKRSLYNTPYEKGYISSILFYCNHLLMGTDRGLLMIYKVGKPEDCASVYPFMTGSYNIQVTSEKIIRLAVAEPIHHKGKGPMIICGTSEGVYTVTFPEMCTE